MLKNKNGVSLKIVAIIVVIILILAGVGITLIFDENDTIQKSRDASKEIGQADKANTQISEYWQEILDKVASKPNEYKHPEQSKTNKDIGIGTDGKPVNLDLWYYRINGAGTGIALNESNGSGVRSSGYSNANITEEGTIIGKMPQYIYMYEKQKIYPVTYVCGVFYNCTKLVTAPELPETATSLEEAFRGCTNLKTAPEIPEGVFGGYRDGGLWYTFADCINLTGELIINSNPSDYTGCFHNAATADDAKLVVSGKSDILDKIIETKSENSHITKEK